MYHTQRKFYLVGSLHAQYKVSIVSQVDSDDETKMTENTIIGEKASKTPHVIKVSFHVLELYRL